MKKILIVNTVRFNMGGISSVILSYLNNMNKSNMSITVVTNSSIEKKYKENLESNNIKIKILNRNKNPLNYVYKLYDLMKKENFDVIHIHGNSATMALESIPAYLTKIPKRIVHAHSVSCNQKVLNKILWPIFKRTFTEALACSKDAGEWLYRGEREFTILNNAINLENYKFVSNIRNNIREKLDLKDKIVIGHVGYFSEDKNQEKLFKIVNQIKNKANIQLLCISGNSEIPDNINAMINKYNIEKNVKILLRKSNVNELLQAMDIFVFPSKHEGLGIALIEAQASGLKCLASDKVPKEAGVCKELVTYCSLEKDSSFWGDLVLELENSNTIQREKDSIKAISILEKNGYSILEECRKLKEIYKK